VTETADDFLRRGEAAAQWFTEHRRGGGHAVDACVIAVRDAWGPNVGLEYVAIADVEGGHPHLVIEVGDAPDSDIAWERMLRAQEQLIAREDELAQRMRVANPFARISIVLAGSPQNWESIVHDIEAAE
jgi:hypothetical protein